jgi:prepilin peptidase CpaA
VIVPLAALLLTAAAWDIRARRIPNALTLAAVLAGLAGNGWRGGWPGLAWSGEGLALAAPLLLPYAVRALGAGDVKLLGAVGALMGPVFLLWTLLGTALAGGLLALAWAASRRALGGTVRNALIVPYLLRAGAGLGAWAPESKAGRMPLAPAVLLGAAFAAARLHLELHLRLLP